MMNRTQKMSRVIRKCIPAVLCLSLTAASGMAVLAEEAAPASDTQNTTSVVLPNGQSVYNLLLIGSDHRDDSWNGNSDVMIVATINADTKKVVLTSFMRDLYADIPGHGVHKLNYAYAVSGADLLEQTLEDNYQIEIDNYASVDFESVAEIIDKIGGVEVELSDAEAAYINKGVSGSALGGAGTYVLNGAQALCHMRNRSVGNSDYERTQRQRNVLSSVFSSMKNADGTQLADLANEVMPDIEHNIGALELVKLIGSLSDISSFELVENRIPYDDLYTSQSEMLVPDFAATIERLHEVMYR